MVADAEYVGADLGAETAFGCRIRGANFSAAENPPVAAGAGADLDVLPVERASWLAAAAEMDDGPGADADAVWVRNGR